MSHGCDNLWLMASVPPPASDLRLCGDASLHAMGLPQPLLGDPGHLRLPAKHDEHSFCVSEGVTNLKARLAGVAASTLHGDVKARPQHARLHGGPYTPCCA
jgi:hypothetical protein